MESDDFNLLQTIYFFQAHSLDDVSYSVVLSEHISSFSFRIILEENSKYVCRKAL